MMKAAVIAAQDIVTRNHLVVAVKGDKGQAVSGVKPHELSNWGCILVYWDGRKHGYWCGPDLLKFCNNGKTPIDPKWFVSVKTEYKPFGDVPAVPESQVSYDYDFGKNLRLVRESRKLSQAALGKAMGKFGAEMAQSTICYREGCPESPSGSFVKAAANALGVPPFVLFVDLKDCQTYNEARRFLAGMSLSLCEG